MKIRSLVDLQDAADREISWRKRELINLRALVSLEDREHYLSYLRRSAICLTYAHWEGVVKNCANQYLEYVARQRLNYGQLQAGLVAVACRGSIRAALASGSINELRQVVDFIRHNHQDRAKLDYDTVVDTHSNVTPGVLREVFFTVGIKYPDSFTMTDHLFETAVLAIRNKIAHGEEVSVDGPSFDSAYNLVTARIDEFKTIILNAASLREFELKISRPST